MNLVLSSKDLVENFKEMKMNLLSSKDLLKKIKENNISKTDTAGASGHYSIYCSKEPKDEFSKTIRGVIFGNDEILIHRGLPYSEDVDVTDEERIAHLLSEKYRACVSHEGTVLKMIYFGGQWNMTTHRRLDATTSRWGNAKTFGVIFKEALLNFFPSYDDFLKALDVKKHYHFLLKSTEETRIVVHPDPSEPFVLTAISDADTFDILPLEELGGVPLAKTLSFENVSDVVDFVSECDPFHSQGLIFFSKDMMQSFRITNTEYMKYSAVRNNIASLDLCYAYNRLKEEKALFEKLYPRAIARGEAFEEKLFAIARQLHTTYIARHVHKRQFRVSRQRHAVLTAIHSFFLTTAKPQGRGVYFDDVVRVLNAQNPLDLYHLVKGLDVVSL